MNNVSLLAWLDDWHMSARLAKLSTLHSYDLKFFEDMPKLLNLDSQILLIIDLDEVDMDKFQGIVSLKDEKSIFVLGYIRKLDSIRLAHFKELGYDMVIHRNKLLMNMESIVKKITNAN
ncbi:uncharacterized protein METZ01_LOCUS423707 [marine metagenome]|uniref:Response regulatory domain-containing protein n=1 Tax=marine metagenome TaxID=408172 RepID=A0A382XIR4_9ZZZZ